jgi:hypothetical protein
VFEGDIKGRADATEKINSAANSCGAVGGLLPRFIPKPGNALSYQATMRFLEDLRQTVNAQLMIKMHRY